MPCPPSVPPTEFARLLGRLSPVALAVLLLAPGPGRAQTAAEPAPEATPKLRSSPQLREDIPSAQRQQMPLFISGERLSGRPDLDVVIEGDASLRRADTAIRADRIEYYQPDDLARARGHVRINRAGNIYEGPEMSLRVDAFEGSFLQPEFYLLKSDGRGKAERIDFLDEDRAVVHNASYTTCRRDGGPNWMPDWILQATRIRVDTEEDVGQADGAVLRFKDVPILPLPSMSFPLSDRRKSGWLPPTVGIDNVNGLEVTVPYYLNLAPNRDATLYTTVMARRGVDFGAELRYLETDYRGDARLSLMPSDSLRDRSRWGLTTNHLGSLAEGIGLMLKLNRVSDDNYWRDFTRNGLSLTQRLLASDGRLNGEIGGFAWTARALKWQTLQDVGAPIVPPYDRLPQLSVHRSTRLGGLELSVDADYTRFQADSTLTGQPNAHRGYLLAQASRPWVWPGGFITPRLQLHATQYRFDSPLGDGATSARRVVPTFSLDSGLVLERDARYFGRAFRQTLEPRLFYVHTPFRDQSRLPNYDSGALDFSLASIYTENAYVGNDRIADNNLLTLGVTTRLFDPDTGGEAVRLGVAQRFRFSDQNVTLPGDAPVSERLSDVLLGASVNWSPAWAMDATVQYNPKTGRSIRTTLGGRYSPGHYRVFNAAYRLQRDLSEQLDLGWQWPINDLWGDRGRDLGPGRGQGPERWYSVGRLNYSLRDGKLVDAIVGLEYDGGCWIGRAVLERLQSSTTTASKRILLQLEFVGMSRVGSNPLRTLRANIPRYEYLREQTTTPSRFSNYD